MNLSCCWKGPSHIFHLSMYSCCHHVGLGTCVATFPKLIMQQYLALSLPFAVRWSVVPSQPSSEPCDPYLPQGNHNFCGTESFHGRLGTWQTLFQQAAGCLGLLLYPEVRGRIKPQIRPITLHSTHFHLGCLICVGLHALSCSSMLSCCTPCPQMRSGFAVSVTEEKFLNYIIILSSIMSSKVNFDSSGQAADCSHQDKESVSLLRSQIHSQPSFPSSLHSQYCRFPTYPLTTWQLRNSSFLV